ncbi:hypothetical protein Plec18170_009716 [Paecilomyces lecythidis]
MKVSTLAAIEFFSLAVGAISSPWDTKSSAVPTASICPSSGPNQLDSIEQEAHGTLSNMTLPANISKDGITNLQLIAFNELFEVSFFEQLLFNLTNHVDGYDLTNNTSGDFIIETILTIQNQEELHALHANQLLQHFGVEPVQPCNYSFPVSTLDEAIEFAALFTSAGLGTLQEILWISAELGDGFLIPDLASITGQEGEQEGFFRVLQNKVPSELPFLTASSREFIFTAVQSYSVQGTCSGLDRINLKTFLPLNLITTPVAETAMVHFTYLNETQFLHHTNLSAAYINQQNRPIVETIFINNTENGTVTAEALFPYNENEMNGLTIMALTNSSGPFENATEVAEATVFGPAFIIVN